MNPLEGIRFVSPAREFRTPIEEGRYRIVLDLGSDTDPGETCVMAESRRFLMETTRTKRGQSLKRVLTVDVRTPRLTPPEANAPGGSSVVLNPRELGAPDWDDELTLSFSGAAPAVRSVTLERADELPVVYLAGDSTVADQDLFPYASWGQTLPLFLDSSLVVANHAESGETLKSFISSLRLAKILERIKPGDYLFIQFCHNDQKAAWPQTWASADSTYPAYLRVFIAEARLRGAVPVLLTAPQRRLFDAAGRIENSHGGYPDAVRLVAEEECVTLIDLESMSRSFYEALGIEESARAFAPQDGTHHSGYGSYELAKCVARGILGSPLSLAAAVPSELVYFDPGRPDPYDEVVARLGEEAAPSRAAPVSANGAGNSKNC